MLLHRARRPRRRDRGALGGTPAGDPRRYRDSSEHLAVVFAVGRPAAVLDAFESLPQIVSSSTGRAAGHGVTVEGVPVELVVAEPRRLGTELLRATGARAYVEALEPLPDAPTEHDVYQRLGIPYCPPELRKRRSAAAAAAALARGHPRRPAHAHNRLRRTGERRGDGARRDRSSAVTYSSEPVARRSSVPNRFGGATTSSTGTPSTVTPYARHSDRSRTETTTGSDSNASST